MSLNRLRAAAKKADTAIHQYNSDDVQQFSTDRHYRDFITELQNASNEDVTNLLVETPIYLRTFLYKTEIAILIITKCDASTLNRNIAAITEERDNENNIHLYHPNRYLFLLLQDSRRVLEALIQKADIEILMQQQRKMPYSPFLFNTDSAYNEQHYGIYLALRKIYKENLSTNSNLAQKALYGLVSMTLSLPNTLFEVEGGQQHLNTLTYNNLKTHSHLTPLFKAYETSTLMNFANNADPKQIRGASTIIMTAGYLLSSGKKPNHKNLVKLLNKLNDCDATDSAGDQQSGWYHLRMAELLGNFDSLALMSKDKKEIMLSNALNHAEHARNFAVSTLLQEDREGLERQQYIDMCDAAENIIDALRSHNPDKFPREESNAAQVIAAIKTRIQKTQWRVESIFSPFPKHVRLIHKEIYAVEMGIKTSAAALRAIEKIARQAASQISLTRYAETQQFYLNMSNAVTRNTLLQLGEIQYRAPAAPGEQLDADIAIRP